MTELRLTIPAIPIAQPRQRSRIVRMGPKLITQNYTPTKHPANQFKATVQLAVEQAYGGAPLTGPVYMEIDFVFPRPGRLIWKSREMPRARHDVKPDRDNLEKSLMDALKGLLFRDDSQVCDGAVRKWYAAGDEQPHVEILVRTLAESEPAPKAEPALFE